ncbi:MAG: hypothetical protein AAF957_00075 [Planctomycetota bacterium]
MATPSSGLRMTRIALALMIALVPAGCGYRAGLGARLDDGSLADTIGIEIFGNESQLPNLERDLHEATSLSARRYLDLVLASPEHADLVLRGSIKQFRRAEGARTADNRTVETSNIVTVQASLIDRSTGAVVGTTSVTTVVGTPIDVPGREPETRERAIAIAADRLVLELVAGLEYGVTRPEAP